MSPRPCPLCLGSGQVWADGEAPADPALAIFWRHRCPVCIGDRVAVQEPPAQEFPGELPAHPGLVSGVCAAGEIMV